MPTYKAALDVTQYVKINTSLVPLLLQSLRDEVRIAFSVIQPTRANEIYHTLSGKDAPLPVNAPDVDVWALAMTDSSALIVTELDQAQVALYDGYGNPISSLNGGLDVHDACIHHVPYNQFMHFATTTTTTLASAASIGDNVLSFSSVTGFAVGNEIEIENGSQEPLFPIIIDITGTDVTIDTPLTFAHDAGTDITLVYTNLAAVGLTTTATPADPVIFTSHIPINATVHVTNMNVIMIENSAMDFTTFVGRAALTNGLALRAQSDGVLASFTNWKKNGDLDADGFSVKFQSKVGGGSYGLAASYEIKRKTESIVYLNGSKGDQFEIIVQEPIEDANRLIKVKLQGHYEGL